MHTPVFLDHNATTPLDPRVRTVLEQAQRDCFGNPSSAGHAYGWAAAELVTRARTQVAEAIGAEPGEILFTSGATEANNLALLGSAPTHGAHRRHLIISNLEHDAVSAPAAELERRGARLTRVACGRDGLLDPEQVAAALDGETWLVSVLAAQNEIGTLQPLADIGRVCKGAGVLFHSDAAQALGRMDLDVQREGLDLLSLSSHKTYGPKGVGALFVRRRDPRVKLAPLLYGGDQEKGLRPGTLNAPGIAAFGEACRLAVAERASESVRVGALRDRLWGRLRTGLAGVSLNGAAAPRLAGNLNVSFAGVRSSGLLPRLTTLAVSAGSACRSGSPGPSRLLLDLGVPEDLAGSSLRIGLGRFTTDEEVTYAADVLIEAVTALRANP